MQSAASNVLGLSKGLNAGRTKRMEEEASVSLRLMRLQEFRKVLRSTNPQGYDMTTQWIKVRARYGRLGRWGLPHATFAP